MVNLKLGVGVYGGEQEVCGERGQLRPEGYVLKLFSYLLCPYLWDASSSSFFAVYRIVDSNVSWNGPAFLRLPMVQTNLVSFAFTSSPPNVV